MSKRVTTRWYAGAWVVEVLAAVLFLRTAHLTAGHVAAVGTSSASGMAWGVLVLAGVVMLVMWICALWALGQAHARGWFISLLLLQLVGLGIVGMVAYAISGPGDVARDDPVRPSFT